MVLGLAGIRGAPGAKREMSGETEKERKESGWQRLRRGREGRKRNLKKELMSWDKVRLLVLGRPGGTGPETQLIPLIGRDTAHPPEVLKGQNRWVKGSAFVWIPAWTMFIEIKSNFKEHR